MQLFTQPSIADTWVVTRSSFIEWFAGSLCLLAHYRVLMLLYCWILTIVRVMHNYIWGWRWGGVWLGSPLQPYTTLQLLLPAVRRPFFLLSNILSHNVTLKTSFYFYNVNSLCQLCHLLWHLLCHILFHLLHHLLCHLLCLHINVITLLINKHHYMLNFSCPITHVLL